MMETVQFWKPKPREPWHDWRTYSLLIPCLVSALGAFVFMALSFSFTELDTLPSQWKTNLVIVGAFAVAFGSTFGSVASGVEIYRKVFAGSVVLWDWVSLVLSVAATVGGFVMGFAALLGATSTWTVAMRLYGPIALGTLVALDSVGDIIEFGGLFGSYEKRFERWLAERETWRRENGIAQVSNGATLADLKARLAEVEEKALWPVARKADFENVVKRTNGQMTVERLEMELARGKMKMPSGGTVSRWLSSVESEGE